MNKKIEKEDYEKLVELLKERNPEYTVEMEFFENFSIGKNSDIRKAKKLIMLKLRLKKEGFPEQKLEEIMIRKELSTILREMGFENISINPDKEGTEYLIYQMESD